MHHPNESVFRAAPLLARLILTSTAPVLLAKAKMWLGAEAKGDVEELRTELLLRYLHCYAPTTPGQFAEWAGIAKSDATRRWAAVIGALVPVHTTNRKAFVLEDDLDALERPVGSRGVRLLPSKDAFLQARDRDLSFPEPGVVLHEAIPVGTWRGAAKGKRYEVTVAPFARLSKAVMAELEAEAQRIARVRRYESGPVVWARD